jgi:hypothetical protein
MAFKAPIFVVDVAVESRRLPAIDVHVFHDKLTGRLHLVVLPKGIPVGQPNPDHATLLK